MLLISSVSLDVSTERERESNNAAVDYQSCFFSANHGKCNANHLCQHILALVQEVSSFPFVLIKSCCQVFDFAQSKVYSLGLQMLNRG